MELIYLSVAFVPLGPIFRSQLHRAPVFRLAWDAKGAIPIGEDSRPVALFPESFRGKTRRSRRLFYLLPLIIGNRILIYGIHIFIAQLGLKFIDDPALQQNLYLSLTQRMPRVKF